MLEPLTRKESFALDLERLVKQLARLQEDAPDGDSDARLGDCVHTLWSEAHRLAPDVVSKNREEG